MNPKLDVQRARIFRLHWGIFVPVGLLSAMTAVPLLGGVFFLEILQKTLGVRLPMVIWLVPLLGILTLDLVLLVATWLAYKKSEVRLSGDKLSFETGLVFRRTGEMPLRNIESIYHSEPLLGRLLGYGSIQVIGKGGTPFILPFLAASKLLHAELQAAIAPVRQAPPFPPSTPPDESRYMPK